MSSLVYHVFTLLVLGFTAYGDDGTGCNDNGLNHLLTENDGDIKTVHCNDSGLNHLLSENDGDIKGVHIDGNVQYNRTVTTPPQIFSPTPPAITLPTLSPIAGPVATAGPFITAKPVVLPASSALITGQTPTKKPTVASTSPVTIALPPPVPTESAVLVPICGKKRNCYQWFDEEWELALDGYTRCNAKDKRRARRFCCIL